MTYYMLYVRDEGTWSPQFGDRSERVVKGEREDTYLRWPGMGYEGDGKYSAKDIRIERFAHMPSDDEVRARAAKLNEGAR